jgi:hypothetical protein
MKGEGIGKKTQLLKDPEKEKAIFKKVLTNHIVAMEEHNIIVFLLSLARKKKCIFHSIRGISTCGTFS